MERVGRVAAVGARVGQRADHLQELHDELGQPWVMISGSAFGSGDRTCRKWIFWPSISVVNCGNWLSCASCARQS